MNQNTKIYDDLYRKDAAELNDLINSDIVSKSLESVLSNKGYEDDYGSWSMGCDRFVRDNFSAMKEWVN